MSSKIPLPPRDQAVFDSMKQIGKRKCDDCGISKGGNDFQIRKIRRRQPIKDSAFHFYHSKICNGCEYLRKRDNPANLTRKPTGPSGVDKVFFCELMPTSV